MAKILVIDDSPTEAQYVRTILEAKGYEVLWAKTGEQGVKLAQEESPDLILMDVVMPGMSGFQATRKLTRSSETSNIPIIMLTTKDQETDRIWGMRNGAKRYMVKPPLPAVLLQMIKEILG